MTAFYPLVFMVTGLLFLFFMEHEIQRRMTRDASELRQDLQEARVQKPEIAALMSEHSKVEANAIAFTSLASLMNLVFAAMMAIPLYSRLRETPKIAAL
jgi:hypothetical protein